MILLFFYLSPSPACYQKFRYDVFCDLSSFDYRKADYPDEVLSYPHFFFVSTSVFPFSWSMHIFNLSERRLTVLILQTTVYSFCSLSSKAAEETQAYTNSQLFLFYYAFLIWRSNGDLVTLNESWSWS